MNKNYNSHHKNDPNSDIYLEVKVCSDFDIIQETLAIAHLMKRATPQVGLETFIINETELKESLDSIIRFLKKTEASILSFLKEQLLHTINPQDGDILVSKDVYEVLQDAIHSSSFGIFEPMYFNDKLLFKYNDNISYTEKVEKMARIKLYIDKINNIKNETPC